MSNGTAMPRLFLLSLLQCEQPNNTSVLCTLVPLPLLAAALRTMVTRRWLCPLMVVIRFRHHQCQALTPAIWTRGELLGGETSTKRAVLFGIS